MTTPPDIEALVGRLEAEAAREANSAGKVQGPAFRGTEWGADLIEAHRARAATYRDAAALIRSLSSERDRLVEALTPFAEASHEGAYSSSRPDEERADIGMWGDLTKGDFRRALSTIKEEG